MSPVYKINEIFTSIQGEGPSVGCQAIFVRFSGCNLKCPFCDTEHDTGREMTQPKLVRRIKHQLTSLGYPAFDVGFKLKGQVQLVLTGGEPLLQVTLFLVEELLDLGFEVCIETNGSNEVLYGERREEIISLLSLCRVVVSPKMKGTSPEILSRANCLKVLCPFDAAPGIDEEDIREMVGHCHPLTEFIFQPVTPGLITNWKFNKNLKGALSLQSLWGRLYRESWRVIPQVHVLLHLK